MEDWKIWQIVDRCNDKFDELIDDPKAFCIFAVKVSWGLLLTLSLLAPVLTGEIKKNLAVMAKITPAMVLENLTVVVFVVGLCILLHKSHKLFRLSVSNLFVKNGMGENFNLLPSKVPFFGILFVILFCLNVPQLAKWEEEVFRSGTTGWMAGLGWSVLFGLSHCIVGVPLCAGFAISVAGLWFTRQYFVGGVELSTLHHTTYNLIILSVLMFFLVIKHTRMFPTKKEGQ